MRICKLGAVLYKGHFIVLIKSVMWCCVYYKMIFIFFNWLTVNIFSTNILYPCDHVMRERDPKHWTPVSLLCWWVNGNQKPMEIGSNSRWQPLALVPAASRVCWFLTSNCLAMRCCFEVDSISVLLCHERMGHWSLQMVFECSWLDLGFFPQKTFCKAELADESLRQWGNHIMFYFHVKCRCPLCMILISDDNPFFMACTCKITDVFTFLCFKNRFIPCSLWEHECSMALITFVVLKLLDFSSPFWVLVQTIPQIMQSSSETVKNHPHQHYLAL